MDGALKLIQAARNKTPPKKTNYLPGLPSLKLPAVRTTKRDAAPVEGGVSRYALPSVKEWREQGGSFTENTLTGMTDKAQQARGTEEELKQARNRLGNANDAAAKRFNLDNGRTAARVNPLTDPLEIARKKAAAEYAELKHQKEEEDTRHFFERQGINRVEAEKDLQKADFAENREKGKTTLKLGAALYTAGDIAKKILPQDSPLKKLLNIGDMISKTGLTSAISDFELDALPYAIDAEMDTLLYRMGKGDIEGTADYLKTIGRDLNRRRQTNVSQQTEKQAQEQPIAGAVGNIAASFTSPLAYLKNGLQAAENAITGDYVPTDVNAKSFRAAHAVNDTQQGIHTAAYEGAKRATGSETWGNIAAFAADTGLSIGQFVSKMPFGAPLALGMMGAGAGGMSTTDALERGATPNQALAEGTISGAVEILTEKLPVDELFRIAKTAPKGVKAVIGNIFKQMGSEGSQEVISEVVNNLADSAIMGDKSAYERYVQSLMAQGATQADARTAATKQFYLYNVAMAGLGGALSGGVMAGGASTVGYTGGKVPKLKGLQSQTAQVEVPSGKIPKLKGLQSQVAQPEAVSGKIPKLPGVGQKNNASMEETIKINPGARLTVRDQMNEMPDKDYDVPKLSMPQEVTVDANGNAVTEGKLPAAIRKYMIGLFRGKVLKVGKDHKVYIDKGGIEEFTFPAKRIDDGLKTAKITAGANLDTTLNTAVFLLNNMDDGRHPEATGGWDNFYVMFETDAGVYSGIVKSKVTERGRVFHDITEIQKEGDFASSRGDNGTNPTPARMQAPSSDTTVPQEQSGVKTQDMQNQGKDSVLASGRIPKLKGLQSQVAQPEAVSEKIPKLPGVGQKNNASEGEAAIAPYQKENHHGTILDSVREHLPEIEGMGSIKILTGTEFQKTDNDTRNLRTKVIDFFNSLGNKVTRADIGEIELNTAGARDSVAHGYGKLKAATYAALPEVLTNGKIIAHNAPYGGYGYDSYIISAPVTVGKETVYVGALVIKDLTQRYKLHEVLTTNESGVSLFKSETTNQSADEPLRNDTPQGEPEGSPSGTTVPQGTAGVNTQDAQNNGNVEKDIAAALEDWKNETEGRDGSHVAAVATDSEAVKKSKREELSDVWSYFKRKIVDAGDSVTKVGKLSGDKHLYSFYNYARASGNTAENMLKPGGAQTSVMGEETGKSLADLWQPIREKGDKYYSDFQSYLYHKHNVDRMSRENGSEVAEAQQRREQFLEQSPYIGKQTEETLRQIAARNGPDSAETIEYLRLVREENRARAITNKPVFGYEISAKESELEAQRLENEHPEFANEAEAIYAYNKNLMQYRVDSGLLTREQADTIERIYPHYVPTFRESERVSRGGDSKNVRTGKTIGRAQGGNAKLMPLHKSMARQTMQVVREGSKNRFGARLLNDAMENKGKIENHVLEVKEYEAGFSPDSFDAENDPTPQVQNTFTVFRDGKAWVIQTEAGLFEGIKALSPDSKERNVAVKIIEGSNDLFKALVTGYNPMFLARNFARDAQDAGLFSRDLKAWAKNYPLAVKEIATNGTYWKKYLAMGGTYSSVFDYDRGYKLDKEHKLLRRYTIDKVEALNVGIEQAPRLAEFMAVLKQGDGSLENLMDAMLAAADVTTNFGRAGTVGKTLNKSFVPFFNPGVQGFDKFARTFFGSKSGKEWAKLILRAAALGIGTGLLNGLLNGDEPDWEDIRDSDKDANFLVKLGDGRWFKIPKGRATSVLGMMADRTGDLLRGESVDIGEFITTAANQMAPANPLENNILAAWTRTELLDKNSTGKTWYGGNIEGQRLQGYAPGERYDESTDVFSKWLGGALNLSPKKINYLLDQYSGVVGDFVLPLLTTRAEQNPFAKAFVLDSASSNRLSEDFYDKSDKIKYSKNSGNDSAAITLRFWNKQQSAVSDIYSEIRDIENDPSLSDWEKRDGVRAAKKIIGGIQKNALHVLPAYEAAVEKHYTGNSDADIDTAYKKANREVFGAEYALNVYSKSTYEKAQKLNAQGVSFEKTLDIQEKYKEINDGDAKSAEKSVAFAHWLAGNGFTAEEQAAVKEAFRFGTYMPAGETIYDKLMGTGIPDKTAYSITEKIGKLRPTPGKADVSPLQKSRVIVNAEMSDLDKMAALGTVMTDSDLAKLDTAWSDCKVPPARYVQYKERLAEIDTNGSVTQEEAKAAIDSLLLTREQKAALWQVQNKAWKPGSNPYSAEVSARVLNAYSGQKAKEAAPQENQDGKVGKLPGLKKPDTDALRKLTGGISLLKLPGLGES